ncbi:hypothetical protein LEP3755_03860 [Leptolyngbya sp. NIES-3755]|nr:hypothetical protein LEP3755_03860 [Leptolyngbya sp. NIES-3755]
MKIGSLMFSPLMLLRLRNSLTSEICLSTKKLLVERDLISQAAFEGALEKVDRA